MEMMDDFEKKYAKGEGEVYFRDKIAIPRYMFPLMLLSLVSMGLFMAFGAKMPITTMAPLLAVMGIFLIGGNLAMMGIRMVVSDAGVDVFVGAFRKHYPLEQIREVALSSYRIRDYPLGRGQSKHNLKGDRAYIGDLGILEGVKITLKSGRHVLITSNQPLQMCQSIKAAIEARHQGEASSDVIFDFGTEQHIEQDAQVESRAEVTK